MLTVEDWAEIRRLYRAEGDAGQAIARAMGISRNAVRAALASDGPPKYQRAPAYLRPAYLRPAYLPPDPASRTAGAISLHEQSLAGREWVLGSYHPAP